jgi:poly(3-hydroxybutyrate) depolymerase
MSVCQPTVPVLAAVALMASENNPIAPRSIIMMGGPIDARKSPTSVNDLATEKPLHWFDLYRSTPVSRLPPKSLSRLFTTRRVRGNES